MCADVPTDIHHPGKPAQAGHSRSKQYPSRLLTVHLVDPVIPDGAKKELRHVSRTSEIDRIR